MNSDLTTIYIMRHGESEANIQKRYGTTSETKLTMQGIKQAHNIANRLRNIHFDKIFSSDFVRAKHTAEIIAAEKKLAVTTTEALRERSYGRMNGKTLEEMKKELKELVDIYIAMSEKEKFTHKLVHDMETAQEALERLIRFIREIAIAYRGKTLLLVCHVTLLRVFLIHLGFGNYHEVVSKNIKNTAYLKVETDGVDFFLKETFGVVKQIPE